MKEFAHDKVVPFRNSPLEKKKQVAEMFNRIAFRYDFLNRLLSAGIDLRWRKRMLESLLPHHPQKLLDVATGTGEVAIMAARILNPQSIIGIDISDGMLQLGREKLLKLGLDQQIRLQNGDSEAINFPEGSFDAVTVAFGVRNFEHLEAGLKEIYRVLKKNGRLVILEFSKPKTQGIQQLYNLYLGLVTPRIGKLISRNAEAYQYLNDSVRKFPEGKDFIDILDATGFKETSCKKLSFGICSIYSGTKF